MTGAELPDGKEITYILDPLGRRVGKKVDGNLVQGFLYAPGIQGPVAELDGAGAVRQTFIYATRSNVPDLVRRGGNTYRVISDHLGSPRMIVNSATGDVAQQITYDAFGKVTEDTSPGFTPFGFAGGLYDNDTGLTHFGAREYDAESGRWTAADPISFAGGDSNLYGYVLSDPVNLVDPIGLFSVAGHRATPSLQEVSDFSAGFGDAAFFGIPARARTLINGVDPANRCTWAYRVGGWAGTANSTVVGFGATAKAVQSARSIAAQGQMIRAMAGELTYQGRMGEEAAAIAQAYRRDLGRWAGQEIVDKSASDRIAGAGNCC